MEFQKQVDVDHYEFSSYVSKRRWASLWHQIDEVLRVNPDKVLEIGVGAGVLRMMLRHFHVPYESVDIDPDLEPTHVGSVTDLPLADNSYDVVACFQVLEHLPYENFVPALKELARVARKRVVISLPDARRVWRYTIYLPFIGRKSFLLKKPGWRPPQHVFNGEHYWEISKADYHLDRVLEDMDRAGLEDVQTFRVFEHSYHRFFVCDSSS